MNIRLAVLSDLPCLTIMYENIVRYMYEQNIQIWDEIYPCTFLEDDIKQRQLYVFEDQQALLGAFALSDFNQGANDITWENSSTSIMYIDRFGVHVDYMKKGIGQMMLQAAIELTASLGAQNVRLFVVDINKPAIRLYERFGFKRAEGYYDEIIDETTRLREYGYEYHI